MNLNRTDLHNRLKMHSNRIINGTIVYKKSHNSGYYHTISTLGETVRFFSKNRNISLFENCEVALVKKNSTYFLDDFVSSGDDAPLKKNPSNIIAASWLAELSKSFFFPEKEEISFIERCRSSLLSSKFDYNTLKSLETDYCRISGYGTNEDMTQILYDCFPGSINIREALINQLKIRGNNDCSS